MIDPSLKILLILLLSAIVAEIAAAAMATMGLVWYIRRKILSGGKE